MAELQDMAAWPPVAEIDRFYEAAFRLEQLVHELRHWAAEGLRQGNAEKALSVVLGEAPRTFTGSVRDLAPILAEARESYRTLRGRDFERLLSSVATRNHGIDLLVDGKAFDSHLQATVSRAKPFVTDVDDFLGALRAYEPPAEDPGRAFDGDDAFMGQRLRGVPLRDWLRFYATQVTRISPTPGQSTELGLCQSRLRKEEAAARAAAAAEDLAAGPSRFLRAATDAEHWILRLWRAFFELRGVVKTAAEAAVTETHPGMFEEFARKFRDVFADRPSVIDRFLATLAGLRSPEPGPRGNWESLSHYLMVLAGMFAQRISHGLRHRGRFEGDPNHFITFEGGTDGPTPEEVRAIQNDDLRRLILDIEALCADASWPVPPSFGAQLNAELKYALACARGIAVDRPEVCGILAPTSLSGTATSTALHVPGPPDLNDATTESPAVARFRSAATESRRHADTRRLPAEAETADVALAKARQLDPVAMMPERIRRLRHHYLLALLWRDCPRPWTHDAARYLVSLALRGRDAEFVEAFGMIARDLYPVDPTLDFQEWAKTRPPPVEAADDLPALFESAVWDEVERHPRGQTSGVKRCRVAPAYDQSSSDISHVPRPERLPTRGRRTTARVSERCGCGGPVLQRRRHRE